MNKRCTNSSCRKTFSTLHSNGQCPFCGKKYPQLRVKETSLEKPKYADELKNYVRRVGFEMSMMKGGTLYKVSFSGWSFIIPSQFRHFIKEAVFLQETGETVKAVKIVRGSSCMGLKHAINYLKAIEKRVQPHIKWSIREVDGCKKLIPLITSAKEQHRVQAEKKPRVPEIGDTVQLGGISTERERKGED